MRVAVGISGGVDSAVTALLLKERGEDVVGVTMTLGRADESRMVEEARAVARRLSIPLEVCDLSALWKREVVGYMRDTYLGGATPNPCVRCNECVKFAALPQWSFEKLGCDGFATGHYARTEGGRLYRGADRSKDQSYFLYRVPKDILERTEFPLGGMMKAEVRARARAAGLTVAERGDSQDFCGGDPKSLIGRADCEGEVVTVDGRVIGHHLGYWHYTVGQRKGLGIGGGTPYYIVGLDAARNRVVVGAREAAFAHGLRLANGVGEIDMSLPVKVRSAGEPRLLSEGIAGIAPGQSAVFYRGEEVVGGGIIVASDAVGVI